MTDKAAETKELSYMTINGWFALFMNLGAFPMSVLLMIRAIPERHGELNVPFLITGILVFCFAFFMMFGYFTLQPNKAKILVLFGKYRGTVRKSGFHWANPFSLSYPRSKYTLSLRLRNFQGDTLKVNDKKGNPIEIGAVVVWRIDNTAQAFFDVDDYDDFVKVQSDSAVRHLASSYPYDHGEGEEMTLRAHVDEVSTELQRQLQDRLNRAGVIVEESRLTHLAYAPEIASAMLKRQQAEAIIAARRKIVHGAVSMVSNKTQFLRYWR